MKKKFIWKSTCIIDDEEIISFLENYYYAKSEEEMAEKAYDDILSDDLIDNFGAECPQEVRDYVGQRCKELAHKWFIGELYNEN